MAKSRRSNIKKAHRAMRRKVMQPLLDEKLREQAAKVYSAIGLPLPAPREPEEEMPSRSHGGFELISTFTPTPEAVKLNAVHGPLANNPEIRLEKEVIGTPIVCAALQARSEMEMQSRAEKKGMEVDDVEYEEAPYFYPRREKGNGGRRRKGSRAGRVGKSRKVLAMDVQATA